MLLNEFLKKIISLVFRALILNLQVNPTRQYPDLSTAIKHYCYTVKNSLGSIYLFIPYTNCIYTNKRDPMLHCPPLV